MIPDRALILALRAAAAALEGDAEAATALIAEARDTLDASCSPLQRHTVAVYGAATEGRAAVDRMLETIHAPTADGRPSMASRSHDIRMACRVIAGL
jgi:hypothetical protein